MRFSGEARFRERFLSVTSRVNAQIIDVLRFVVLIL